MAETIDDAGLVKAYKGGDDSAFERIVERYCADVGVLANRLLGWPGEVDDVVQDVFLKALGGIKRFRGQSSLRTWLFAITINTCRTRRARRSVRLRMEREAAMESSAESPSGVTLDADSCEAVRRKVAELPGKYREVVVLAYLEQMSREQISGILGISRNTLRVRLNRAREQLKLELEPFAEDRK